MTDRKYGRKTGGRFAAGNPGKPLGARHRVTLAVEALLEGQAEALTRTAIAAALDGDSVALRLCLERIAPVKRERAITFMMPRIATATDVPHALAAVVEAVGAGELTPSEGVAVAGLLDRFRCAYELEELERRIAVLESGANR